MLLDMLRYVLQKAYLLYCRSKFLELGNGTRINPTAHLADKRCMKIGHNCFIGKHCHISIVEPSSLSIGNYAIISPYVRILGGDHNMSRVGEYLINVKDGGVNLPIIIEDDVMVGMGSTILKGVTIGEGAIIAAGAVVTRNVSPYSVYGGNPAKRISSRFSKEELVLHLSIVNSKYRIEDIDREGL